MASGVIEKPDKVFSFGIAANKSGSLPLVQGQLIFVSRTSVGIIGFIAVDMLNEVTYYGTNNFMTNITATISNNQITVNNNAGVALQITAIYPS